MRRPLAISVGDPAGIGPEVTAKALAAELGDDSAVIFGEASELRALLQAEGVPVKDAPAPGAVVLAELGEVSREARARREPSAEGGAFQLRGLLEAARMALRGEASALVTGPTSKAAVELSGVRFSGQTEALAEVASIPAEGVTMMFLGPRLSVALATTHLSVASAAASVTPARVARSATHLAEALGRLHAGRALTLAVTGVNPHAGEGGLFGREEIDAVTPGIEEARSQARGAEIVGPIPAEAAFRYAADGRYAGVVAMLHDQATIASKLLDWGEAVNVTWGLPFVRASVDHGVAYDIAGRGVADASGMRAAIRMAKRLRGEG